MPLTYATFLTRRHRQQMVKAVLPLLAKRLKFNEHHDELGRFAESDGSASITSTPEFRAWFRESKVVDEQGRPLVVYHGTRLADDLHSLYFSDSAQNAATYASGGWVEYPSDWRHIEPGIQETGVTGANVLPVYLSLQNPLIIDAKGGLFSHLPLPEDFASRLPVSAFRSPFSIEQAAHYAQQQGYDGVIVRNVIDTRGGHTDPQTTLVAFNKLQVKSATGNTGDFSLTDSRIGRSFSKDFDESLHPRDEAGKFTDGLPVAPGTTPIAPGHVRGYHYTGNLEAVLAEGLDVSHARGSTYGEPNGIWMSTVKPGGHKDFVEVHVTPDEIVLNGPDLFPYQGQTPQQRLDEYNAGGHDFILKNAVIPPSRFVTHFTAWHETARYLLDHTNDYPMTAAKIDELLQLRETMPDTPQARAITYWVGLARQRLASGKGWVDVKDWDEAAHPREPAGTSEGGQFAGDGSSVAVAELVLNPAVVEVGGDTWNQQTATRLETEYQQAKPALETLIGKLEHMTPAEAVEITTNDVPQSWDALSGSEQEKAEEKWKEQHYSSALDSEIENWQQNDALVAAAKEVAEDDEWKTEQVQEWLDGYEPVPEGITAEAIAENITIEALENYGDDAAKQLGEIAFSEHGLAVLGPNDNPDQTNLPGMEPTGVANWLTEEMRADLRSVITDNWDHQVEHVAQNMEAPDYIGEQATDMLNEEWSMMDDEQKYEYAKEEFGDSWEPEEQTTSTFSAFARPSTYSLFDNKTEGYQATARFATILSQQRTAQLMAERGIDLGGDPTDPASLLAIAKNIDRETWNEWKDKSYTPMARAMQLATARELGGLERYMPEEELDIIHWAMDNVQGGLPAMQAYARAKWETTQYLMEQAGTHDLTAYRGIFLNEVTDLKERGIQGQEVRYENAIHTKLPALSVQRNGLASFTTSPGVANGWGGVGTRPANPVRVVIRATVPRTAVMSLPVYGQNLHGEKEVVLIGTAWKAWDAWKNEAPHAKYVPVKSLAHPHQWLAREGEKVLIDLSRMEEVQQLPHWLSGIRAQPVGRKSIAAKWAEEDHPREPAGSPEGGEFTSGAGGAYAHLTPVQAKRLQQHEEWVKTDYTAKEEALVMDKDGRMMVITSNSKRLVRFTPEQLAAMPGSILTHNHPDDRIAKTKTGESAGFFSSKDLVFAHDNRLKEMRVTTTKKIYSVTPIQSTWPPKMLVASLYTHANKAASQWVQDHPGETKGQVMVAWSDKMMDSSLKNYFRFKSWDRP